MPSRTIVHVRNGQNITLLYSKKSPSTGAYFDNTQITAVAVEIVKADGTVLTPSNAPTVTHFTTAGGFKGYRITWNPGTDLDSLPWALIVLKPTLAGISNALAMPREYELDLSDLAKRQDEIEAKVDTVDAVVDSIRATDVPALQADLDDIQGKIGTNSDAATDPSAASGTLFSKVRGAGDDLDTTKSHLTDIKGSGWSAATDSLEKIRDENLAEHDTTQSKVDQVGAASEAQLIASPRIGRPDIGTRTYKLEFILKDLDLAPVALVDPDSNIVTVMATDPTGSGPLGVTLANAGVMSRASAGVYHLDVLVDSTAVDGTQVRFTANYSRSGVANLAKTSTVVEEHIGQLDDIESGVETLLTRVGQSGDAAGSATLFGKIKDVDQDLATHETNRAAEATTNQAEHDATQSAIASARNELATHEASESTRHTTQLAEHDDTQARIGQATDGAAAATLFGKVKAHEDARASMQTALATDHANLIAEHNATQALLEHASFGLAAIKAVVDAMNTKLGASTDAAGAATLFGQIRKAIDNYLADSTHGLVALNADLDTILARLGVTTDTGGSTTTGTVMAKINRALELIPGGVTPTVELEFG